MCYHITKAVDGELDSSLHIYCFQLTTSSQAFSCLIYPENLAISFIQRVSRTFEVSVYLPNVVHR